jgi:hypothetical protein
MTSGPSGQAQKESVNLPIMGKPVSAAYRPRSRAMGCTGLPHPSNRPDPISALHGLQAGAQRLEFGTEAMYFLNQLIGDYGRQRSDRAHSSPSFSERLAHLSGGSVRKIRCRFSLGTCLRVRPRSAAVESTFSFGTLKFRGGVRPCAQQPEFFGAFGAPVGGVGPENSLQVLSRNMLAGEAEVGGGGKTVSSGTVFGRGKIVLFRNDLSLPQPRHERRSGLPHPSDRVNRLSARRPLSPPPGAAEVVRNRPRSCGWCCSC